MMIASVDQPGELRRRREPTRSQRQVASRTPNGGSASGPGATAVIANAARAVAPATPRGPRPARAGEPFGTPRCRRAAGLRATRSREVPRRRRGRSRAQPGAGCGGPPRDRRPGSPARPRDSGGAGSERRSAGVGSAGVVDTVVLLMSAGSRAASRAGLSRGR